MSDHQANPFAPKSPSHSPQNPSSYLDAPITLETYRTLLGLPTPRDTSTDIEPSTHTSHQDDDVDVLPQRLPRWWPTSLIPRTSSEYTPLLRGTDLEHAREPQGIYPSLLYTLRTTQRTLHRHAALKTTILLSQLVLSILLILLASLPFHSLGTNSAFIAIIAALNGIGAGVLALASGREAERTKLARYREGLRGLRARIEWVEREVAEGLRVVAYREVVGIRDEFEGLREGLGDVDVGN